MRSLKRRTAIASATTIIAGSAAAIALAAAGPGTPESHEYGGSTTLELVDGAGRLCEGTDGTYYEFNTHYQSYNSGSSDPRFDGPSEAFLHYLMREDGVGHADGNITYYDGDTGKRLANASVVTTFGPSQNSSSDDGPFNEVGGYGFIGGRRGTPDGNVSALGDLPRGVIYTPTTFGSIFFAVFFGYGIGEGPSGAHPAGPENGGLVQSFACKGKYESFNFNGGPNSTRTTKGVASRFTARPQLSRQAAVTGVTRALRRSGAHDAQVRTMQRLMAGSLR